MRELDHIKKALGYNGYPEWMMEEPRDEVKETEVGDTEMNSETSVTAGNPRRKYPVVLPYIRGLSEQLRRTLGGIWSANLLQTDQHFTANIGKTQGPIGQR